MGETFIILGVLIISLILIFVFKARKQLRCDKCHKFKLKEVSREEIQRERITMTKRTTERVKYGNGEWRDVQREFQVPGIRVYYKVDKVCANCGAQKQMTIYEDYEQ